MNVLRPQNLKNKLNIDFFKRFRHFNHSIFFNTDQENEGEKFQNDKENKRILTKDIIYNALEQNGVKHAFIFSGGSIMPVIDRLYNSDIKYTVNSHEQNCGHAAMGMQKHLIKQVLF